MSILILRFMFWTLYILNRMTASEDVIRSGGNWRLESDLLEEIERRGAKP